MPYNMVFDPRLQPALNLSCSHPGVLTPTGYGNEKYPLAMSTVSGWWYTYPSEKYDFVNWDVDIPNIWKN